MLTGESNKRIAINSKTGDFDGHVRAPVKLGANLQADGTCEFSVWAPQRNNIAIHLFSGSEDRCIPMIRLEDGYHQAQVCNLQPHSRYLYRLDPSQEFPDPASRFQPEGVHRPSEVVDLTAFPWTDSGWKPPCLEESIFYEAHVGTYSEQGTLDAMRGCLSDIAELGVTTIELMPVAQFPGSRNWGYDGVYPFAVQNTYGGPLALQRFVNAAHSHGLAVALDVVYNHLGPEGNYLGQFAPYFTEKYRTPWGMAINFDGADSGPVRRFFIENALSWFDHFHIDVLRLDSIHGIFDFGAHHFLAELQRTVESEGKRLGRNLYLIAESDLNDARVLQPREIGGYGLPAQWSDDFHHSVHTLLTHETAGYYADFGTLEHLAGVLRDGWFYHGQYSWFRRRRHGNCPYGIPRSHFVVCSQNHDQVGNRARGERLTALVGFEAQKLAAGITLLSPFVPLLFMGEEYGETSPFQYFTNHADHELIDAVRRGRREEFVAFGWASEIPDPDNEATFANSKLLPQLREKDPHRALRMFYQELIQFRRRNHLGETADLEIVEHESLGSLMVVRKLRACSLLMLFNFSHGEIALSGAIPAGRWICELNSSDSKWLGPVNQRPQLFSADHKITLPGQSFAVFSQNQPGGRP